MENPITHQFIDNLGTTLHNRVYDKNKNNRVNTKFKPNVHLKLDQVRECVFTLGSITMDGKLSRVNKIKRKA